MQLRKQNRFPAVIAIAALAAWPAAAQKSPARDLPAFRADSSLVLVPVTVVNRRGGIVNGLASNAFILTEDGVRQPIRSFAEEDAPVSIGVVFDLSGSMKSVLVAARDSLRRLLQDANPADEAFLNAVSTRPRTFSGFTTDFDELLSRVAFQTATGSTALIDTIDQSLQQLHGGVHARKALLVISDGMDNHSRRSREEMLRRAVESDAQIYTIAVGNTAAPSTKAIALTAEKQGLLLLDELAARTGGLSFVVHSQRDIGAAAANIGQALRNQYTIGYAPLANDRDGKWHRIGVKVADSKMRAYARTGYRID